MISTNCSLFRILIFIMLTGLISGCVSFTDNDTLTPSSKVSDNIIETTPQPSMEKKTDLINTTPTATNTVTPTATFASIEGESQNNSVTDPDGIPEPYDPFLKWSDDAGEVIKIHYDFSKMSEYDVEKYLEINRSDYEASENGLIWKINKQEAELTIWPRKDILYSIDEVNISKIMVHYSMQKPEIDADDDENLEVIFSESNMFFDFRCEKDAKSSYPARISAGAKYWLLSIDFENKNIFYIQSKLAELRTSDLGEMYFIELFPFKTNDEGIQDIYHEKIFLVEENSPFDLQKYINAFDNNKNIFPNYAHYWEGFDCYSPILDEIGFRSELESGIDATLLDIYIVGTKK